MIDWTAGLVAFFLTLLALVIAGAVLAVLMAAFGFIGVVIFLGLLIASIVGIMVATA